MITQKEQAQLNHIKEALLKIDVQGLDEVTLDPTNKQLILRFDNHNNGVTFSNILKLFDINDDYILLGNELSMDTTLESMCKAIQDLSPHKNLSYAPDNRFTKKNRDVKLMMSLKKIIDECYDYLSQQKAKQTSRISFLHRAVSVNSVDEKKKDFVDQLKKNLMGLFDNQVKAQDVLDFINHKLDEPDNPAFKLVFGVAGVSPVKKVYEDAKNLVASFLQYDICEVNTISLNEKDPKYFQTEVNDEKFDDKELDEFVVIQPASESTDSTTTLSFFETKELQAEISKQAPQFTEIDTSSSSSRGVTRAWGKKA